jgi:hypothetical protein
MGDDVLMEFKRYYCGQKIEMSFATNPVGERELGQWCIYNFMGNVVYLSMTFDDKKGATDFLSRAF